MPSPSPLRSSLALCLLAASPLLHAAEGGVGRPITGQQIYSNAGIHPPEPGWVMSLTSIYYDGELKGSGQVPIIGDLSSGLKMKVSYTMGNFTRVWDTGKGRWNYASAIGVPVQYTDIQASLTGPRGRTVGTQDSGTQFADLLVTPIAAGYHINERDHIALSLPIYVPTGAYNDNRLANPGQNNYTFMPTIAFTHLDGKGGEFSLMGALEFYTRNDAADYRNGDILRLDGLWTTASAAAGTPAGGRLHPADQRRPGPHRRQTQRLSRALRGRRADPGLERQVRRRPGQHQRALDPEFRHQEPPRGQRRQRQPDPGLFLTGVRHAALSKGPCRPARPALGRYPAARRR